MVTKPVDKFYKSKIPWAKGYDYTCKVCLSIRQRIWRQANKGAINARNLKYRRKHPHKILGMRLKHRYGITYEQYKEMYDRQKGRCLICKEHGERLAVDHCHKTNQIRGLLCRPCNSAIGYFKDNPTKMRAAAKYIETTRTAFQLRNHVFELKLNL